MQLQDRVAIVTGSAQGIGRAIAKKLASGGARVLATDIQGEKVARVAEEIGEAGGIALPFGADVSNAVEVDQMVKLALDTYGQIDILVNNAGIYRTERVEEVSSELWDQVMGINAKGVFLGTKHAIPEMRNAGGGSIINISSVAGLVGNHISAAYSASKGAVRLLTKSTAIQYAKEGIRCNSVHPGTIETPMTADMLADQQYRQDRMERTPLGRLGTAQDVAYGVLYLASDESSFVTGSELVIDGGRTAQ